MWTKLSFVSSAWLHDSAALHVTAKLLRSASPEPTLIPMKLFYKFSLHLRITQSRRAVKYVIIIQVTLVF